MNAKSAKKVSPDNVQNKTIVGTHINPGYWGSFLALVVGMGIILFVSIHDGVPEHAKGKAPAFFFVLAIVFISSLRYYIAVSVNVYEQYSGAILNWPKKLRIIAFSILCALIFLCNVGVAALAGMGTGLALTICILMSVASLLLFGGTWVAEQVKPTLFSNPGSTIAFGDFFLIALLWLAAVSITDSDPSRFTVLWIAGFVAVMLFGLELNKLYARPFLNQLSELWTHMVR